MVDVQEEPITPTLSSPHSGHSRRDSSPPAAEETTDGADDEGLGDDFDDFEEGDEDADFDDFDDGFQEPEEMPATPASPPSSAPAIQPLSFVCQCPGYHDYKYKACADTHPAANT